MLFVLCRSVERSSQRKSRGSERFSAASLASRHGFFRKGCADSVISRARILSLSFDVQRASSIGYLILRPNSCVLTLPLLLPEEGSQLERPRMLPKIPIVFTQVVDPVGFRGHPCKAWRKHHRTICPTGGARREATRAAQGNGSQALPSWRSSAREIHIDGPEMKEIKLAGRAMGLQLQSVEIPRSAGPNDWTMPSRQFPKGAYNGLFGLFVPEFSLHRQADRRASGEASSSIGI